jgi:hypothetical protein
MAKKTWIKVGSVLKSSKPRPDGGVQQPFVALGNAKDKYKPVTVELVVKDATGKIIATTENGTLSIQDPRKRPGITPEQAAKIPETLRQDLFLVVD